MQMNLRMRLKERFYLPRFVGREIVGDGGTFGAVHGSLCLTAVGNVK
jgi:hypothetical protein